MRNRSGGGKVQGPILSRLQDLYAEKARRATVRNTAAVTTFAASGPNRAGLPGGRNRPRIKAGDILANSNGSTYTALQGESDGNVWTISHGTGKPERLAVQTDGRIGPAERDSHKDIFAQGGFSSRSFDSEDIMEPQAPGQYGLYRGPREGEEPEVTEQIKMTQPAVEKATGRESRWTGTLTLDPAATFSGKVDYNMNMTLSTGILDEQHYKWRTIIHELLHTISPQFSRMEFDNNPGWEEGVVEQMQRMIRQSVLRDVGVAIPEEDFAERDTTHRYNAYISALEVLRDILKLDRENFYPILLSIPLRDRRTWVMEQIDALPVVSQIATKRPAILAYGALAKRIQESEP